MHRFLRMTALGLLTLAWVGMVQAQDRAAIVKVKVPAPETATCGDFGTTVTFEESPSLAARKALKEEKLVMVLHVSGDFEDPAFT